MERHAYGDNSPLTLARDESVVESLTIDGTRGKGRSKSESSNHQN